MNFEIMTFRIIEMDTLVKENEKDVYLDYMKHILAADEVKLKDSFLVGHRTFNLLEVSGELDLISLNKSKLNREGLKIEWEIDFFQKSNIDYYCCFCKAGFSGIWNSAMPLKEGKCCYNCHRSNLMLVTSDYVFI